VYQKSRRKLVIPFLAPAFIVYTLFEVLALVLTVSYSFTNWEGYTLEKPFFGLGNYLLMLTDIQIQNAMRNTAIFSISGVLMLFLPALFMSWALTQGIKGKGVVRYIVIVPTLLSVVVVSLLWKLLYNPVYGPINNLLKLVGLGVLALPWLGDTRTALLAIVLATAWQQLGMWVLLMSAGLERIPQELLEAARIDGANEWHVFWKVTLPLLWGVLRLLFILWIILSLQVFAQVWVMAPQGGAARSADVMGTVIYERAFAGHQWGFACAMATTLLIAILSLSLVTNRLTRRETIEY
jgi:ABC-type sugar transport system permease subunit